ncbi:MAG: cell division protein FtsA [Prevotella sp.]|nr:cell division protein FtsA [Prevotella sp.]
MAAAKDFIVAIELGSSKMTGIAGQKNLDGSITVLAVVKEDSSSFIRKGYVYNIDKTAQCLTNIIKKLETQLKTEILQVYVGVGGQSIRSVRNIVPKDLPADTRITQDMVIELMDSNRNMTYPDQEILDAAVQEYKVDSQYQLDPVGIQASRLEGNFLNILERKAFYRNLNKCFEVAGINVAEMYLAPLALADSVLTEAEKRSGCALVDIGSDTTTVSVYSKNILRHLAVIPLGSNNITKDIATLQMEESDAEKMKLKYGSAYTDNNDIDNNLKYSIDNERQVESRKFIEIVEGRLEEIIENVWYQIPNDYYDKLLGGIILTGGGSNMKNIEQAFINHTHVEKIRIAKFVTNTINATQEDIKAKDGRMNTVLGLLVKGDINCAGQAIDPNGDLFGTQRESSLAGTKEPSLTQSRQARQASEIPQGVIRTEAEKQKAEEEARRKKEEEDRIRQEEEEAERKRIAQEKKENSVWNKAFKGLKRFTKSIIEEEE